MAAHDTDQARQRLAHAETPMVVEKMKNGYFDISFLDTIYGQQLAEAAPPTLVGIVMPGTPREEIRRMLCPRRR